MTIALSRWLYTYRCGCFASSLLLARSLAYAHSMSTGVCVCECVCAEHDLVKKWEWRSHHHSNAIETPKEININMIWYTQSNILYCHWVVISHDHFAHSSSSRFRNVFIIRMVNAYQKLNFQQSKMCVCLIYFDRHEFSLGILILEYSLCTSSSLIQSGTFFFLVGFIYYFKPTFFDLHLFIYCCCHDLQGTHILKQTAIK